MNIVSKRSLNFGQKGELTKIAKRLKKFFLFQCCFKNFKGTTIFNFLANSVFNLKSHTFFHINYTSNAICETFFILSTSMEYGETIYSQWPFKYLLLFKLVRSRRMQKRFNYYINVFQRKLLSSFNVLLCNSFLGTLHLMLLKYLKKFFQFEYFFSERSINEIECERSEVENYCDKNLSTLSSCSHNLHFSDIISTTMIEQIKSELYKIK